MYSELCRSTIATMPCMALKLIGDGGGKRAGMGQIQTWPPAAIIYDVPRLGQNRLRTLNLVGLCRSKVLLASSHHVPAEIHVHVCVHTTCVLCTRRNNIKCMSAAHPKASECGRCVLGAPISTRSAHKKYMCFAQTKTSLMSFSSFVHRFSF